MINLPFNVELANATYYLMQKQERQGVCFDVEAAKELVKYIDNRMQEIKDEVEPKLPQRPLNKGEQRDWTPPKIQFKKDGTPSANCLKWFELVMLDDEDKWVGLKNKGSYRLPHNEPIINSLPMELKHQQYLKNWFMSLGWKPTLWNFQKKNGSFVRENGQLVKTSPKFHDKGRLCPNLESLGDKVSLCKPIVEWLSLRNRRSVLLNEEKGSGWLSNPRLAVDGRLGAASSGLTNTKRQKHTVVANVPSSDALLGHEFRSLFRARKGMTMVGADASGLEARIKGHYTFKYDGGEYARKLLDPDFDEHQENAELWGCARNDAKSPGYALQYNCQPPKFAETLGVSLAEGLPHYDAYWRQNWAVKDAITETEQEFERNFKKYITTIDGSKIVTRAKHSVFNAKCQSTGAKCMDLAGWIADEMLTEAGIEAYRTIYYHDELQYECYPDDAERVGEILVEAIREAGKRFNLNVPLDGEYKIGKSWADTH